MSSIVTCDDDPSMMIGRSPIRIVILSDVRFLRDALVTLLERSDKVRIIGVASEAGAELRRALLQRPDIVLVDTALSNGLAAVRYIKQCAPAVRIVALALAEREDDVIAWAESGISGYIPRSASFHEVIPHLEGAMRDEQLCSPRVASGLMRRIGIGCPALQPNERKTLTQRELEIIRLVSEGLSNKEIARSLKIGLATTKSHVHNALGKLGLIRRGQAAHWVREQALTLAPSDQPLERSEPLNARTER